MNYASQAVQVQVLELLKRVKIWEDLANEEQEQEEEVNYKDFEGLDEDWEDFNST